MPDNLSTRTSSSLNRASTPQGKTRASEYSPLFKLTIQLRCVNLPVHKCFWMCQVSAQIVHLPGCSLFLTLANPRLTRTMPGETITSGALWRNLSRLFHVQLSGSPASVADGDDT